MQSTFKHSINFASKFSTIYWDYWHNDTITLRKSTSDRSEKSTNKNKTTFKTSSPPKPFLTTRLLKSWINQHHNQRLYFCSTMWQFFQRKRFSNCYQKLDFVEWLENRHSSTSHIMPSQTTTYQNQKSINNQNIFQTNNMHLQNICV